ncbi:hypothetical protein NP233_g10061 [Leucocoprinus birnbaumii]|uniref:Uncharacterized protein n=1 Tax=Leucocoprinus birnbaumii TaxID=56174 RepID=A0AAD5YS98_9AGAR|nr:hypothetical protein NP233_g10061 [Leucocoprinus birnbaumii]
MNPKRNSGSKVKTPDVQLPEGARSKERYAWSNPWVFGLERLTRPSTGRAAQPSGPDVSTAADHMPLSPIHEETTYSRGSIGGSRVESRTYETLGVEYAQPTAPEGAEASSSKRYISPRDARQVQFAQAPQFSMNKFEDEPYGLPMHQHMSAVTSNTSLRLDPNSPYIEDEDSSFQMTPTFDYFPSPLPEPDVPHQNLWSVQGTLVTESSSLHHPGNKLYVMAKPRREGISDIPASIVNNQNADMYSQPGIKSLAPKSMASDPTVVQRAQRISLRVGQSHVNPVYEPDYDAMPRAV